MNDNQWLKEAKQVDEGAITKLFEQTRNSAYFVAKQYVKSDSDVEDVLQDSYVKALKHLEDVKDEQHFIKWFHCIVANTGKDFLKKKNPMLFSDLTDENHEIEVAETRLEFSPEHLQDYKETQRMVMDIISRLPDDQRMCLIMYYYDELNSREIAAALQIPEATVKSRLKYAKHKLVYEVEEYEKTNQVKLHSSMIMPFVVYTLQEAAESCELPGGLSNALLKYLIKGKLRFYQTFAFKCLLSAAAAVVACVCGYLIWLYESDLMTLKKETVEIEYGAQFSYDPNDYVICKRKRVCELAKVEIDIEKGKDEPYAKAGAYEGRVIHRNETEQFKVLIKDSKQPQIVFKKDKLSITEGDSFDPAANIKSVKDPVDGAIKRSKEASIESDGYVIKNSVDKNSPGNYTVTVIAYDKNKNKDEKSYQVTVKKKPQEKPPVQKPATYTAANIAASKSEIGSATGAAVAKAAKSFVGNSSAWYSSASCINTAAASLEKAGVNSDMLYTVYHDLGKGHYKQYEVSSLQVGDVVMYYSTLGVYHTAVYIGGGMAVHGGFPHVAEEPQEGMVTVQISTYNCAAASEVKIFRFW